MSIHISGTLSESQMRWRSILDKYVHIQHNLQGNVAKSILT